jgi:hypothetical protein
MMADAPSDYRSQNLTPEEGKSVAVATLFPKVQGEPNESIVFIDRSWHSDRFHITSDVVMIQL